MKVKLWGTRGSLASPGPETMRYGGNTSCVEVRGPEGTLLILDAGTGLRRLAATMPQNLRRVDILLTHLHMDHIQGLGFFAPLRRAGVEAHVWGPAGATLSLRALLTRYMSPPLFPVVLRELPCTLVLHEVPCPETQIGEFTVSSALISHPGPTVGYRVTSPHASMAYLPDHEPALGVRDFPGQKEWTSGFSLAEGVDLLIHDAQYTREEYAGKVGWGHSSLEQTFKFARLAGVKRLTPFHYDPDHSDADLDRMIEQQKAASDWPFSVVPGMEGATINLHP